jgi:hypothetical protein
MYPIRIDNKKITITYNGATISAKGDLAQVLIYSFAAYYC